MPSFLQEYYCCCNVFPVTYGLYLIAFHCLLQGMYGVGLVVTTTHLNLFLIVNFVIALSHSLLIPAGIAVLWTNLYESYKGARLSAIALLVVSLANLASGVAYLIFYLNFKANSMLDKILFWRSTDDWIDDRDFPFTFWHVEVIFLLLTTPLWWYYAYVLYKYSKIMKSHRAKKIRLRLPKHKTRKQNSRKVSFKRKKRKTKELEKEDQIEPEPKKPKRVREPKEPKPVHEPKEPKPVHEPKKPKPVHEPKPPKPVHEPKKPKPVHEPKPPKPVHEPKPPKPHKQSSKNKKVKPEEGEDPTWNPNAAHNPPKTEIKPHKASKLKHKEEPEPI